MTDEESGLQKAFLVLAFSLSIKENSHPEGFCVRLSSSTASRSPFPAGEGISLRSRTKNAPKNRNLHINPTKKRRPCDLLLIGMEITLRRSRHRRFLYTNYTHSFLTNKIGFLHLLLRLMFSCMYQTYIFLNVDISSYIL